MQKRLVFSRRELIRRVEQAQRMLEEAHLDCLFLTSDENYHYFTGGAGIARRGSDARPNIVIVPAEGQPTAVTSSLFTYVIEQAGLVSDIRSYNSVIGAPNEILVKALKDTGLKNKSVGVEIGYEQRLNMPLKDYVQLTQSLPDVRFVDASELIWGLRMVKSEEEVALIARACDIVGRARQETFREVDVGMTEREISRLFAQHMLQDGADGVSFIHVAAGMPGNTTCIPLERHAKRGDVLYLDGGAYVRTYTCDYARIAILGKPTAEQIRVHTAVTRANRKMAETLKPGITCADIFAVGDRILREEGLATLKTDATNVGRMGHGQGMLFTEPPSIHPLDKTVLRPGMVISTEPGAANTAGGEFIWEDVHVIREDGSEQLSTESEEFYEI
jgi:Xaa-Pro dipeptidase